VETRTSGSEERAGEPGRPKGRHRTPPPTPTSGALRAASGRPPARQPHDANRGCRPHAGQGGTKQVIGSRAGGQHPRRSPPQQPLRDPLLEGITQIRENVHLAEAPSHHEPITMSEPYSTGAADYRELAHELMKGGR
jgi:hypothetical protein